ncbi:unnamed protein product, partial [Iphiclides podalirius]
MVLKPLWLSAEYCTVRTEPSATVFAVNDVTVAAIMLELVVSVSSARDETHPYLASDKSRRRCNVADYGCGVVCWGAGVSYGGNAVCGTGLFMTHDVLGRDGVAGGDTGGSGISGNRGSLVGEGSSMNGHWGGVDSLGLVVSHDALGGNGCGR